VIPKRVKLKPEVGFYLWVIKPDTTAIIVI
jgi:hypothetical protein